eukprot:COSAG02_NODE_329_length_24516_cov_11.403448_4_plen_1184_part_00
MADNDARARKANAARRRELRAWKEENGVPHDTKVFVMDAPAKNKQGDEAVRDYLEGLGWHYNEAVEPPESLMFDLRFQRLRRRSSRDRVKDAEGQGEPWHATSAAGGDPLAPFQLTNHFTHSGCITTKTGLVRTLQHVRFMGDADPDEFAPRAYCINDPDDMAVFYDDYRRVAAECALFGIVERSSNGTATNIVVNKALLDACEAICARKLAAAPDLEDEETKASGGSIVTPVKAVEWEVLRAAQELTTAQRGDFSHGWRGVISDQKLQLPETAAKPDVAVNVTAELDQDYNNINRTSALTEKMRAKAAAARSATRERERAMVVEKSKELVPIDPDRLAALRGCLANLQNVGGRQHTLHAGVRTTGTDAVQDNGDVEISRQPNCYQGLWIVKPAKLSRGRGIRVFNTLSDLLAYVGPSKGVKTRRQIQIGGWMVMKYIERPLTIGRRKWDMRQWVLVASWNPLVVFMNKECYARFAVEEYDETLTDPTKEVLLGDEARVDEDGDLSDGDDGNSSDSSDDAGDSDSSDGDAYQRQKSKQKAANISARGGFVHLVNNSVSKYSDNFSRTFTAENGKVVSGHMLNNADLSEYLRWHSGGQNDVYADTVKPAMEQIAKSVLKCVVAQGHPKQRENSYEVFGFDFFIDEQYKPWLIEINSSPAVDYSTPVTEAYCSEGLVDSVKVGVSWKAWWLKVRAMNIEVGSNREAEVTSPKDGNCSHTGSNDIDIENEMTSERVGIDWDEQPDVGVWECLMSREELLASAVETDPNRGEKVPKLELAGRSVKALQNESKRRKAEAKKEEERKRARAQRAADAKAAQEAAAEQFRLDRQRREEEEERMLQVFQQEKIVETTASDKRCDSPNDIEQGLHKEHEGQEGRRVAPCRTPPRFELSPKSSHGVVVGVREHQRIPMRPHSEKFARPRAPLGFGHCYHLDHGAGRPASGIESERQQMLAVSRSKESTLTALAGYCRQAQQTTTKQHRQEVWRSAAGSSTELERNSSPRYQYQRDGGLVESEGRLLAATTAAGVGSRQQAMQMLNHIESLRHASQRQISPIADSELSLRLLSRISHLESVQNRPTPAQNAGMAMSSAARHTTGAIRWQMSLDRAGRKPSLAKSWQRVSQLEEPMQIADPTNRGHVHRSHTPSHTAATAEFTRMRRERDRVTTNTRAEGRSERPRRSETVGLTK